MARTTGGAARRNTRRATPSAQEMLNSFGKEIFGNEFKGAVTAASKGEFNQITDVMYDDTQSMEHYNPTQYRNLAGKNWFEDPMLQFDDKGNPLSSSRPLYEVVGLTGDLMIPGLQPTAKNRGEADTSPADITLVPTSTTNPQRPRTVAAGYDEYEQKLTVVFRDGTFYNYYDVDANEWKTFKSNRSKGAVIARMLDFKPRGPADVNSLNTAAQEAFYRFSRGSQIHVKGAVAGQTKTTYKTIAQTNRGKNPSKGGKNPKGK